MPRRSIQYKTLRAFEEERFQDLDFYLESLSKKTKGAYEDSTAWIPGTGPEKMVYNYLLKLGVNFEFQYHARDIDSTFYPEDVWIPDFQLPDYNIIIEVYGSYWHSLPARKESDIKKMNTWAYAGYTVMQNGMVLTPQLQGSTGKVVMWWEYEIYSDLTRLFVRDLPELLAPDVKRGKPAELIMDIETARRRQVGLSTRMAISRMRPSISSVERRISRRFKIRTPVNQLEKEMKALERQLGIK